MERALINFPVFILFLLIHTHKNRAEKMYQVKCFLYISLLQLYSYVGKEKLYDTEGDNTWQKDVNNSVLLPLHYI